MMIKDFVSFTQVSHTSIIITISAGPAISINPSLPGTHLSSVEWGKGFPRMETLGNNWTRDPSYFVFLQILKSL